ncbi:TY5A, partial [Symbiodinium necroappetens]
EDWWHDQQPSQEAGGYYEEDPDEPDLHDVEAFLAEHGTVTDDVPEEIFQEDEVAEVLAATWKDKRQELNRLHRSRRFAQAREVKRSFKVEVEAGSASAGAATASSASGASMVQAQGQHFVCYVSAVVPPEQGKPTMLQVLRDRLRRGPEEALLVSSPGYAVLDSGCGRSIVGEETLAQFRRLWTKAGIDQPRPSAERNTFRFGNGHEEVTNKVVEMPIMVAGRRGAVRAAVIKGQAPLLLSRAALKRLKAQMDFDADELMIFESKTPVRMIEAGQYMIPVANFENASDPQPRESCSHCLSAEVRSFEGSDEWSLEGDKLIRYHRTRRSCPFFPDESDCPVPLKQLADSCTVVKVNEHGLESSSQAEWKVPKVLEEPAWVGRTVFQVLPPPAPMIPENEIALS